MASRALCAIAITLLAGGAARAQDPVALYPENYRVLRENERVRVIDFRLANGARENAHHHRPHVVYVLQGFASASPFPTARLRSARRRAATCCGARR